MIPALAGFMAGGARPVAVIDQPADTGAVSEASAGSFSVSSGTNRLLVAIHHLSGDQDSIGTLFYGGQTMTERVAVVSGGGFPTRVKIWTLGEAGIQAAVGTAFSVTGNVNGGYRTTALTLENVDQGNPIVDSGSGIEVGGNPQDIVLNTEEGGYAVAGIMFDHNALGNNIDWGSDLTERLELTTSSTGNTYGVADALTDGSNVTADPTTTRTTDQQCHAAISVRPG